MMMLDYKGGRGLCDISADPFQLTPYFWATFSWPPSLSKFENKKPPPPLLIFFGGGGNYDCSLQKSPVIIGQAVIGG